MKFFTISMTAAVLAATAATAAQAAAPRLTDASYLQAERCRGLIGSKALGEIDTTSIDAFIKDQSRGRVSYIVDRGESARADAEREARKAGPDAKAKLIAERDGACSNYKS